jgi:methyltransferase OMS1, mitochondrial
MSRISIKTAMSSSLPRFAHGKAQFREPPRRSSLPSDIPLPPAKPSYRLWVLGGSAVCLFTGYISYSAVKGTLDPTEKAPLYVPEDVSDRYDKTAKDFDSEVGLQEFFMGLGWLRWWLTRKASGNVLEVSVGTGRNSSYYKLGKCESISMIDQSPQMIEVARAKFISECPTAAISIEPWRLRC